MAKKTRKRPQPPVTFSVVGTFSGAAAALLGRAGPALDPSRLKVVLAKKDREANSPVSTEPKKIRPVVTLIEVRSTRPPEQSRTKHDASRKSDFIFHPDR